MNNKFFILFIFAFLISLEFVSACTLTPTLINQDPYPAVPGDYVKLVFQLTGVQDASCGTVTFELLSQYPISFDPGVSSVTTINSGGYVANNYSSSLLIPYQVRVDPNALDGNNLIGVRYAPNLNLNNNNGYFVNNFNINVQNVKATFEIFVKNYNPSTGIVTFEILNIGKNDVSSLTLKIPQQNNVILQGPPVNVIGTLNSNDFTTADFQLKPSVGNITLNIEYTDSVNIRRSTNATAYFDPSYFNNKPASGGFSIYYVIGIIIILALGYWYYRRRKKEKRRKLLEK